MPRVIIPWLILLALIASACSRAEETPTATRAATATPAATSRISPTATTAPTATLTPSPTPIQPQVIVDDQVINEEGVLTIEQVTAAEAGWLVIHAADNGNVGPVLGHAAVEAGDNEAVTVTIDPLEATETLYAMLHVDAGESGEYEFPGADAPVQANGAAVSSRFDVEIDIPVPSIIVTNQDLDEEAQVRVEQVVTTVDSWLVIHADDDGEPGPMVGQVHLPAGESTEVQIPINRYIATPRLYAMLYEDTGEPGRFEYPEADSPVLINSRPVISFFDVTMPPDVLVYDQPVIDGLITIERVISYGPGWIVLYSDNDGQINLIIGFARLQDGVNRQVAVPVSELATTPVVHAVIHQDTEEIGAFEYPPADPQFRYQERLQVFSFQTDLGNFVVTRDQPLGPEGEVVVPRVVVRVPVWVIVRTDEDGAPGEIIGQQLLPPGYHLNVAITLEDNVEPGLLHVILHQDGGTRDVFNYPAEDPILRVGTREIRAPFRLLRTP